jgi:predicted DNA-binding transcriptional regulator AlpA
VSEPATPSPQTLDRSSLARLLGVSLRTLDRMRHDRGFPRPLTGGRRKPLWARPVIDRWLHQA